MINKKTLLLTAAICMSIGFANASDLVQMDIKKSSDNAVDITFFTTGNTNSPMVTRKSDNKYVVLMPNVSGSNTGAPSLSAVKDLITNVDVKNVDDGMNGYTKVTFTTTKPINIKTHTQKTAPLSTEEKNAKAIIAQIKTQPKQVQTQTQTKAEPKKDSLKTSTAPKTSTVNKTETKKTETKKTENKNTEVKKQTTSPTRKTESVTPVAANTVNSVQPKETTPAVSDVAAVNFKEIDKISKSKQSSKSNNLGWLILLLPAGLLYLIAKGIKNSVQKSEALKFSFNENLSQKPYKQTTYDNIINDSELNWQERYKKFLAESKGEDYKPAKQEPSKEVVETTNNISSLEQSSNSDNNGRYHFITPMKENKGNKQMIRTTVKNALSETDVKRLELEKTIEQTPEIYKNTEIKIDEAPASQVKTEDETISQNISKLKSFAKPVSLHTSHRNRTKKEFPKSNKMHEGRFVQLKDSELNTTSRHFKDGALSVSDLMNTGKKLMEMSDMETSQNDYIMSSVDEYLSILDKENSYATAPKDLSSKIANSLSNVKPSMKLGPKTAAVNNSSNPIKQSRTSSSEGLIVKKSYNIDDNHGFHLVNLDGVNSLIGRANNETFVLHNFDKAPSDLQVRHDSANVYMVKSGDFKALVDVSEDKMGVLIEL